MTAAITTMRTKGAKDGQPGMRHECRAVPIECCGTCLLWAKPPKMSIGGVWNYQGKCRRYPQEIVKNESDWCGEWQSWEDVE